MRASTIVHCFGLLAIFTLLILIGQFLFSSLTKRDTQEIYRVFPITAIPLTVEKIRRLFHPEIQDVPQEVTRSRMILHLFSGSEVQGELIREDEGWITLNIDGSEVGFSRKEIREIFRSEEV